MVVDTVDQLLDDHKYVLGISVDISKAFDTALWPLVIHQLRAIDCPANIFHLLQDYLRNRKAVLHWGQHSVQKSITRGCPQGSVCGPLLWNITFNSFLGESFGQDKLYAYADDVILLMGGRSRADLERRANLMLGKVNNWGTEHKLLFNPAKTKGIVYNRSGKPNLYRRPPHIKMNGKTIKIERAIKYLGVIMDHRLSWDQHIEFITKRTGLITQAFMQVARNSWGLSSEAMSTIHDHIYVPMITYACGSWGWAVQKVHPKRKLISSQRKVLLLITKAYRTAPTHSLQILARKPPIDLTISMNVKLHHARWGLDIQTNDSCIHSSAIERPYRYCNIPCPGTYTKIKSSSPHLAKIELYTDGSKMNDSIGCSFVVYEDSREIHHDCFRLDRNCSVFQAELVALRTAISWSIANYANTSIHIYTDCLSACNIIGSNSLHHLACEISDLVTNSNNHYSISWTRAHQGTVGNERADFLAKSATSSNSIPIIYNKISKRCLRHILWTECLQIWQNNWNQENQCTTYKFIPNIQQFFSLKWFTPSFPVTQLITNHGKFASYFYRFTLSDTNLCPICQTEDNSAHYIYDCITLEKERLDLRLLVEDSGHTWPCDRNVILSSKEIYKAFSRLAKKFVELSLVIILNFMKRFGNVSLCLSIGGLFVIDKKIPLKMAKTLQSVLSGLLKLRNVSNLEKECDNFVTNYTSYN
ncbi:uncharacterized protein [Centruroides vittatus]|uniref:uncharacterized protein n=1 Tax=Centruroides vittatus TaxID=120091 RepID=UPI00350F308C